MLRKIVNKHLTVKIGDEYLHSLELFVTRANRKTVSRLLNFFSNYVSQGYATGTTVEIFVAMVLPLA